MNTVMDMKKAENTDYCVETVADVMQRLNLAENSKHERKKNKMRQKRKDDFRKNRRIKLLAELDRDTPIGLCLENEQKMPKTYYVRVYKGAGHKTMKKLTNKSVRQCNGEIGNGSAYKKYGKSEYWF